MIKGSIYTYIETTWLHFSCFLGMVCLNIALYDHSSLVVVGKQLNFPLITSVISLWRLPVPGFDIQWVEIS